MTRWAVNTATLGQPEGEHRLDELLAAARDAGFDAVGIDLRLIEREIKKGFSLAMTRRRLEELGLECLEVSFVILRLQPAGSLERARRLAEVAGALGARWVNAAVDGDPTAPDLVALARDAADAAGHAGAGLTVEPLPWLGVRTIGDAKRLIALVGRGNVRLQLDTWHFARSGDSWEDLAKLDAGEIAFVQWADARAERTDDAFEDQKWRALPGEGTLDLARFARTLRALRYSGPIEMEVFGPASRELGPALAARRQLEAGRASAA